MEDQDEFKSDAIHILVDLLKGRDYEEIRRINYLVNLARQDDLKESFNKLKNTPIEKLSDFADMVTRVYKDDKEFLENEPGRLDEIFITNRVNNREGKMERFISICNCEYIALNLSNKEFKEVYKQLYQRCRNRY